MDRTMTRRICTGAVALSLLAGGGVLAGCGSSSSGSDTAASTAAADAATQVPNGVEKLPAKEILAASLAASKAASSVTVKGVAAEGEEPATRLDLEVGTEAGQGTINLGAITMNIRRVGDRSFYKISAEDFGRIVGAPDNPDDAKALASLLDDNWINDTGDDGALGSFSEFLQKDEMLASFISPKGTATVTGTGEVNGIPVVFLTVTGEDGPGVLAIQTVGEPYPVQLKTKAPSAGVIRFTNWNAPVSVTAPANVIGPEDFEKLAAERGGSSSTSG